MPSGAGGNRKRLTLTANGKMRYELKTPYSNGTTHVIFEPLDFLSRLAAMVPAPRVNLTRYHGVFAPNSQYRVRVTPAKRGRGKPVKPLDEAQEQTPAERRASMSWPLSHIPVLRGTGTSCPMGRAIEASVQD